MPQAVRDRRIRAQHPGNRLLSPIAATDDDILVGAGPLYASETVARIGDVRTAIELVAELTP